MDRTPHGLVGVAVALGSAALLAGCPNPNTYGTPRTTPDGKFSHTIALEGIDINASLPTVSANGKAGTQPYGIVLPLLPTYQLRYGVADRVDFGVRVANLDSLAADVKWNFLRTKTIDLAVDPGVQGMYISTTNNGQTEGLFVYYGHLPVLLGVNLGEAVSLVPSLGVVYAGSTATASDSQLYASVTAAGLLARGGLGLRVQTGEHFALPPEVTVMRLLSGIETTLVVFGLGFDFGSLPSYAAEPDHERERPSGSGEARPAASASAAPSGTEDVLARPPPPPPAVGDDGCATSCVPDATSTLTADAQRSTAVAMQPILRQARACLARVGAQAVQPNALLVFGPDGQLVRMRLDVGGNEQLECIASLEGRLPAVRVGHAATVRCEHRCPAQ